MEPWKGRNARAGLADEHGPGERLVKGEERIDSLKLRDELKGLEVVEK